MKYHYKRAKHFGDRTRTWVGLGLWVGLLLAPPVSSSEPEPGESTGTSHWATQSKVTAEESGGELKRYEFTGTEMAVSDQASILHQLQRNRKCRREYRFFAEFTI